MACWDYDRTRALRESRVAFDGIELTYLPLVVEETFFRMLRYHEFDVAELSLSSYTLSLFADKPQFIAIPIFPVAHVPPQRNLHQCEQRNSRAEGSCRQTNRNAGIPIDGAGLAARHPER